MMMMMKLTYVYFKAYEIKIMRQIQFDTGVVFNWCRISASNGTETLPVRSCSPVMDDRDDQDDGDDTERAGFLSHDHHYGSDSLSLPKFLCRYLCCCCLVSCDASVRAVKVNSSIGSSSHGDSESFITNEIVRLMLGARDFFALVVSWMDFYQ